jgi:hypothetical protein
MRWYSTCLKSIFEAWLFLIIGKCGTPKDSLFKSEILISELLILRHQKSLRKLLHIEWTVRKANTLGLQENSSLSGLVVCQDWVKYSRIWLSGNGLSGNLL